MSHWDERYAQAGYWYGEAPNDFLRAVAGQLAAGADVLSIGEGEGRNGVYLATLGHRVTGVDASALGLAKAEALAAARGVVIDVVEASLETFDLGVDRWDGIVSIWCHLPTALRRDVHARVVRALKSGGLVMLEAYRPEQLEYGTGGPSDPSMLYRLDDLRRDFTGLDIVHGVEIVREVHEGVGHHGLSAVVQLVARKPAPG